jgi:hypothetical protein
MDLDSASFIYGLICGFLIAGVFGFLIQKIREALYAIGAPDRPMRVETRQTPRFVMRAAAQAFSNLMIWLFWLMVWLVAVVGFLYLLLGDPSALFATSLFLAR